MGSPYVPLDSWVYPAIERLMGLGLIDSGFLAHRPWTRWECARLITEADDHGVILMRKPAGFTPRCRKSPVQDGHAQAVIAAPAPVRVIAMAAPQTVNLAAKPQAASVPNNDRIPPPSAWAIQTAPSTTSTAPPFQCQSGRWLCRHELRKHRKRPAFHQGRSRNGSPGGTSIHGNSVVAVAGIPTASPQAQAPARPSARSTSRRPRRARAQARPRRLAGAAQAGQAHRQAQAGVHRRGASAPYRRRRHPPRRGLGNGLDPSSGVVSALTRPRRERQARRHGHQV